MTDINEFKRQIGGVSIGILNEMEEVFGLNINVYKLKPEDELDEEEKTMITMKNKTTCSTMLREK